MNDTDSTIVNSPSAPTKEVLMTATLQSEIAQLVETRLNAGERVTVVNLAKELKVPVNEVRNALVEEFGNRVTFKRGRTGGIVLS